MHRQRKIVFIKAGNFSHTNESVSKILFQYFPDYAIEVLDIFSVLTNKRDLKAVYYFLKAYGYGMLTGKRPIKCNLHQTSYMFGKIREIILRKLMNQKIDLTFQTQSIFDASIPGIPNIVYTDHTHLANLKYPGFPESHLCVQDWIGCERSIYHNAALNLTMSSNISNSIIEDYKVSPGKVKCVYSGSNVLVKKNEIFDRNRYKSKNILFVGIDWRRKGGPVLARAFQSVKRRYPDTSLTIVGCKPGLKLKGCEETGEIPLSEVKRQYLKASVFCLPTLVEPLGISFLEAMAHKLPVIGTKIGAIPDIIDQGLNGYLIDPNDSEQLSTYLMDLLISEEKCRSFGEKGYNIFWNKYTWEKTGERIYKNILPYLN